jgi:hypothetical protein
MRNAFRSAPRKTPRIGSLGRDTVGRETVQAFRRETAALVRRFGWIVTIAIAFFAGACRMPPRSTSVEGANAAPTASAATSAERRAREARAPRQRADALLDAAEIYVALDRHDDARRVLRLARKSYNEGPTAARSHRLLGALYLATGDIAVAERYLLRTLDEPESASARGEIVARLVVCARARGDALAEERYRSWLPASLSPEIQTILALQIAPTSISPKTDYVDSLVERHRPRSAAAKLPSIAKGAKPAPSRKNAVATPINAVPREKWGPSPVKRNGSVPMSRIHRITVHHTAGPSFWGQSDDAVADEIRRIQRYHQREQGWADIGYHFLIDRAGRIWQGRDLRLQGAHARDQNAGNIGVALLGNYDQQEVTPAQRRSLAAFISILATRYSVSSTNLYTHREICNGKTACPGPRVARIVDDIRARLSAAGLVAYRP